MPRPYANALIDVSVRGRTYFVLGRFVGARSRGEDAFKAGIFNLPWPWGDSWIDRNLLISLMVSIAFMLKRFDSWWLDWEEGREMSWTGNDLPGKIKTLNVSVIAIETSDRFWNICDWYLGYRCLYLLGCAIMKFCEGRIFGQRWASTTHPNRQLDEDSTIHSLSWTNLGFEETYRP